MKRKSLLTLLAGAVLVSLGVSSCQKPVEGTNTLKVDPMSGFMFAASGNADEVLTITTDADSWSVEKPDWVMADKKDNKLTVNVSDNTGEYRSGTIKITAGTAQAVTIGVGQEGGTAPGDKSAVSMFHGDGTHEANFRVGPGDASGVVYLSIPANTSTAVSAEIYVDGEYLDEYNVRNEGAECQLFPAELVTIAGNGSVTIAAGDKLSGDVKIDMAFDTSKLSFDVDYLLPLHVRVKSDNAEVADGTESRVNYIIRRNLEKEVRNIVYFEVNDCNPLNALEYKLESGDYFFDAVVLFSSNINYNSGEDRVYIHHNPNNQALFDGADLYVKPLREAGIKVYLSILGNHTPAGICTLSEWGNKQFALEVAETVDRYGLDGVCFDDEYTSGTAASNWFAGSSSTANASRMMYECKKAMREICGEEKDVVVFAYNTLSVNNINAAGAVDGVQPGQFIDIATADYGGQTPTLNGGTRKQSAGASVELNNNRGAYMATEAYARQVKADGYGWFMWFALNVKATGFGENGKQYDEAKYNRNLSALQAVSKGLYDKPLLAPTHYYAKIQEGQYDNTRRAY